MTTLNATNLFPPFILVGAARQACDGALQTFMTDLKPQLGSLTDSEHVSLPRISANLDEFSDKGLAYGRSNPELLPASVDIDGYQNDTDVVVTLTPYLQGLKVLVTMIEDRIECARAGRYIRASAFYQSAKIGAKLNHPGAAAIRDDMGIAFANYGRRRKMKTPPPSSAE